MNKMKCLIVGLGNPEGKYFQTWHNLGFLAVEKLGPTLEWKKRGNQLVAKMGNALLLKPLTYMNRSGEAVVALARKQGIPPENIIVLVDDLYIDKGHIRVARGGSGGGHNGLRSINQLLGSNQYIKIRIGIKPEKPPYSLASYVLDKIPTEERTLIDEAINKAVEATQQLLSGMLLDRVQQVYNSKNQVTGG